MIYLIGFFILAALALVAWQMDFFKSKFICTCDKCDDTNCKCEENKCGDNCKCHDAVVEAPAPYLNGHSKKVTAVVEEEAPTEAPAPTPEPEAPVAPEQPKEEPKKEEPKKAKPAPKKEDPKKAAPKKKKKK
jgi:type IV secretory pathway VirB10-like protein